MVKYVLTSYKDTFKFVEDVYLAHDKQEEKIDIHENRIEIHPGITIELNKQTYKLAKEFWRKKIDSDRIRFLFQDIVKAQEFAMNGRRSFYCMICSAEGLNAI